MSMNAYLPFRPSGKTGKEERFLSLALTVHLLQQEQSTCDFLLRLNTDR
jgi:hypothetical protein